MVKKLILAGLLTFCISCLGQDFLGMSETDRLEFVLKERQELDKELNRVYSDLRKAVSKEEFALVKEAQLKWLQFYSAQNDVRILLLSKTEGSLNRFLLELDYNDILRNRIDDLGELLNFQETR